MSEELPPQQAALAYLNKYPNMPCKALWNALTDTSYGETSHPEVAMAIILHPQCGLERIMRREEGPIESMCGWGIAHGVTPLLLAVLAARDDVVIALIAAGADVKARNPTTLATAFHIAAAVDDNIRSLEALANACKEYILVTDSLGRTPLHDAARYGRSKVIEFLISKGAHLITQDNSGWTPLHWAIRHGHAEALEVLIAHGADITTTDYRNKLPIFLAAESGHEGVLSILLGRTGVDVRGEKNWTPLHIAAAGGHHRVVRLLIDKGASIHSRTSEGLTPLHLAALNCRDKCISVLCANGALITEMDGDGWTPLHHAVYCGHVAAVVELLAQGADAGITNMDGWCSLQMAAGNKNDAVLKAIIASGASLSHHDTMESTPLHRAAHILWADGIAILLAEGADSSANNSDFLTPLELFNIYHRYNFGVKCTGAEAERIIALLGGSTE